MGKDYGNEESIKEKAVLTRAFRSIVTFANVHLSLAQSNQLLLYAYGNGMSKKVILYLLVEETIIYSSCYMTQFDQIILIHLPV